MKTSKQITFNLSPDIGFKEFMNLYKKCPAKPHSFLVIDNAPASDNSSCFRRNLLETIWKLIMTNEDKIRDEKLQHDVKREATKTSPLSSGKIYKYEYLTGAETLPSDESRMIEEFEI